MQVETKTCSRYFKRPAIVIPSDNIRLCKKPLDGTTTTSSAYVYHGGYEPVSSFKPKRKYVPSGTESASETTHKLSYQPLPIEQREPFPWAQKKPYRPPKAALDSNTTYSESFLPVGNASRSRPIKPRQNSEWVRKSQFAGTSSYSEAFVPLQMEPVVPKVPSGNIGFSKDKMESETTNKMSYRHWGPLARESLPWKKKQPYRQPTQPLDDNSIYRSSYVTPEAYCYEECDGPSCPLAGNFGMCLN
ncbi:stabilizer of axonemal microtubules 1-like [Cotesia glomerata]|uniref:Uncharacterized protein n=1 Tax=Cotesia glomerata TaxID=32391 RepID=A0AAV7IPL0_COTGL|nr:stabilizer of axonemal microtubules 1-like [Cotesia glomerata]KAH0554540.1 hypothetical protein KQX54_011217 [Cotesia glomerata]